MIETILAITVVLGTFILLLEAHDRYIAGLRPVYQVTVHKGQDTEDWDEADERKLHEAWDYEEEEPTKLEVESIDHSSLKRRYCRPCDRKFKNAWGLAIHNGHIHGDN